MTEKEILEKKPEEKDADASKLSDALVEKQPPAERKEVPTTDLSADADTTVGEVVDSLESVIGEVVAEQPPSDESNTNTALVETAAMPSPEPFLGRGLLEPYRVEGTDQIAFFASRSKTFRTSCCMPKKPCSSITSWMMRLFCG
jgi:hypothetical protein